MKKIFVSVALVMMVFTSCTEKYDEFPTGKYDNPELRSFLEPCCKVAYELHKWMAEGENMCQEYDCCWEYVSTALRAKYESGATLTIEEMEAILADLEKSPSFIDTLAEFDEFIDLDYYREYGIEWFSPNYGYEDDDF